MTKNQTEPLCPTTSIKYSLFSFFSGYQEANIINKQTGLHFEF
jgi:hypothetical protein